MTKSQTAETHIVTMNGGTVHVANDHGMPACTPNGTIRRFAGGVNYRTTSDDYRQVQHDVTCRRCSASARSGE